MDHTYHASLQLLEPMAQDALSNSHSAFFQPLLHRLLTAFCEGRVIPAMTAEEVRRVVYLSRFHDIGKQSLPRSILQKSGKLTLEERRILQQHPALGVRLLRTIPALRQYPYYDVLYDICLHHHERWDGGGYPDGLTGRHITPYVHVVALADAYDALRTARPYTALSRRGPVHALRRRLRRVFSGDDLLSPGTLGGILCRLLWGGA